ncbi:MAG: hypothetical protein IPJ66_01295 [Bacteroidetes bacterium]|nr:hypothetical protein [Bacteroidota bacterium]MBL0064592.1 hypothetical protein [Bacteroidota bacterium]
MPFALHHMIDYSSDEVQIYFAGEFEGEIYHETFKRKYIQSHFEDLRQILKRLRNLKHVGIFPEVFRMRKYNGELVIKEEGDKTDNVKALLYDEKQYVDNIFRVYCIWPVINEKIIIIGGGCLKDSGGALQDYEECRQTNQKMRELGGLIQLAIAKQELYIIEDKLKSDHREITIL